MNKVVVSEVGECGITLVQLPVPSRLAAGLAVTLPAGSRHEEPDEIGVAHLLEHLAFKGTEAHRTSTEFNRAAGYLATEISAITSTNDVEFSTVVRAELTMAAAKLLIELIATPLLDESGLESERRVILQEIADGNEDPASRADALLSAAMFSGHRLALDVAGGAAEVGRLTHDHVLRFRDRQWSLRAGIVVVAGNLDHLDARQLVEQLETIPDRPAPRPLRPVPPFSPRVEVEQRDSEVVHLRLAYSIPGIDLRTRQDRARAEVFSQLIGGPMGSRLYEELRERRALCYWVEAQVWGHESETYLSVSCSVRPSDLDHTLERIQTILADLSANGPTDEEVRRFSTYSTGVAALSFESIGERMDHAIALITEYGDYAIDPRLLINELQLVGRQELNDLANNIQPRPCIGAAGPITAADF